jgi:hypothetical protein
MEDINNFFYFFNEYDANSIVEEGKKLLEKIINEYKNNKN